MDHNARGVRPRKSDIESKVILCQASALVWSVTVFIGVVVGSWQLFIYKWVLVINIQKLDTGEDTKWEMQGSREDLCRSNDSLLLGLVWTGRLRMRC